MIPSPPDALRSRAGEGFVVGNEANSRYKSTMAFTALRTLPPVATAANTKAQPAITLSFTPPLPNLQNYPSPLTLTVNASTQTANGTQLTLALPDGRTLQAQSPTPLPVGTPLQLPSIPLPTPDAAALTPILVRALPLPLPPPVANPVFPSVPAPVAAPPTTLPIPLPNTPAATPFVAALATLTLTHSSVQPAPLQIFPTTTPLPGPVVLTVQTPLPPTAIGQAATLTLQSPTRGTLALPTTNNPQSYNITLPNPLNFPLKQEIPLIIQKNVTNTQVNATSNPLQLATVLPPSTLPPTVPLSTVPSSAAQQTGTSALLNSLRLLLPPSGPAEGPPPIPLGISVARVLPQPTHTATPHLQPLLLANGTVIELELPPAANLNIATSANTNLNITKALPTPLPAGSVLVVSIPTLTGPTQILQLHSNQPQLLPQSPTATGTTVATAVQTPQAPLPVGTALQGTIIGQNAQGQPLLRFTLPALTGQTFALTLQPQSVLPQNPHAASTATSPLINTLVLGAQVQIQINPNGSATLLALNLPPAAARAATLATLGSQWPSLANTLTLLQSTAPNLATQARANLPQLANLLPGLLRLLESFPTADPAKLLGPEAAKLAQTLGSTLGADLAQLQLLSQRPEEGGWRGVLFPYTENPEGQPQQGGFFWRREKEDDPRSATSTRFVAELELSALGPLQLDGLLSYPTLWLKLRSHTPLPDETAQGLAVLVTDLLQQFGLEGGLATETTHIFPLNPAQEIRAHAETSLGRPS